MLGYLVEAFKNSLGRLRVDTASGIGHLQKQELGILLQQTSLNFYSAALGVKLYGVWRWCETNEFRDKLYWVCCGARRVLVVPMSLRTGPNWLPDADMGLRYVSMWDRVIPMWDALISMWKRVIATWK